AQIPALIQIDYRNKTLRRAFSHIALFLLLFLFARPSQAQQLDSGIWNSFGLSQNIGDLRIKYELGLRTRYGLSITDRLFHNLNLRYRLHKRINVAVAYRFGHNEPFLDARAFHRIALDLQYNRKLLKGLRFKWRPRLQSRWFAAEPGLPPLLKHRQKFSLNYKLRKRLYAWTAYEFFIRLNDPEFGTWPEKMRYYLGLDYEFKKRNKVTVFYLHQREMNQRAPVYEHILGLEFSHRFKKMKWKKKKKKSGSKSKD
ncbi:MAG: DUF2490 domain-containing protein, partial [Bacteroidota bacterium]